jgi:RecA/RadA recombinase
MAAPKKAQSLHEKIAARLRLVSAEKQGKGLIEATTSKEGILSDVKYVLKLGLDPYDDLVGGLPFGRIYEWFGLEGCGKSALCIRASAQANDGEIYERVRLPDNSFKLNKLDPSTYELSILYIDNEGSLDGSEYIEVNGKRIDVVIARAETVDAVFKSIDETISLLMKVEEEEKKEGGTPKQQFLLVIVDTIAGTASKEELSQAWGKDDFSRQPKAMHEGMRVMGQIIQRQNVCVVCTNQATDNIGYEEKSFGKPMIPDHEKYRSSGGKALKYWSTNRLFLAPVRKNYKLLWDDRYPSGVATGFRSVKNRIRPPLREGLLVLLYDRTGMGGFSNELSILETLIKDGFAEEDYEAKEIVFKFRLSGVQPTTFPDLMKSLAEQDAEAGTKGKKDRYKDPRIHSRAAFPKFHAEHKADFDALWQKLLERAFIIRGAHGEPTETLPTEGGSAEAVAQPEEETPRKRGGRRPNPLTELADKV